MLAAGLLLSASAAHAAGSYIYWADPGQTTIYSFDDATKGDKALQALGFASPSVTPPGTPLTDTRLPMTNADFLKFNDGFLSMNDPDGVGPQTLGRYGWNDEIPRDTTVSGSTSSKYDFNPERGDLATNFAGEGNVPPTGTLAEVFGPFASQGRISIAPSASTAGTDENTIGPYKNLSYILDGEDQASGYSVDLLFGKGPGGNYKHIEVDNDDGTLEVAILERGGNSDFNVYGVKGYDGLGNAILTGPVFVERQSNGTPQLWGLDTLEIGGKQKVVGYGLSLDSSWGKIIGFRIEAPLDSNGPDIVGVGTPADAIPEPVFYQFGTLLLLGGVGVIRRRRKVQTTNE